MNLRLEQVQKQTQKLVLSPQMQQAIHILQLPLMDLKSLTLQEMMENPVLEEVDLEKTLSEDKNDTQENQTMEEVTFEEEFNKLVELDDEWREYFRQSGHINKSTSHDEDRYRYFQESITSAETLQDHLTHQLMITDIGESDRQICKYIIGNIDDNGYMTVSTEELSAATDIPPEHIEMLVSLIQSFHPTGVCTRSIEECLLLQLERLNKTDEITKNIVRYHLNDIAAKRFHTIAKSLCVSIEEVKEAALLISSLDPKPGRLFTGSKAQYIIPDIIVEKVDDVYEVILNDTTIPHIRISNSYRNLMNTDDEFSKDYVKGKIKSALWFIKNINHRQQTVYKIAKKIVELQNTFMDEGISKLKPMTLQTVAQGLGIHESTVSRAIANKYIQTPQGLFQLKYFFTAGLQTENGESISTENVKDKIAAIIREENPKKPYSDIKITRILKNEGINCARRTVAKYRTELGLQPAHLRKEI